MSKSQNVLSNFFWRLLERVGAQGVAFIISIVLARLLNPAVYGTVALVNVFMIILQVFVDSLPPLLELRIRFLEVGGDDADIVSRTFVGQTMRHKVAFCRHD